MAEADYCKRDIACEYLDAAIECFLAKSNLFCAIHLAAAAEELFGAHLPKDRRISTFAWKAEKALLSEFGQTVSDNAARKSVNEWKNEVKHMDDEMESTLKIDPVFAAKYQIEQALINFRTLKLKDTPSILKFERHQIQPKIKKS